MKARASLLFLLCLSAAVDQANATTIDIFAAGDIADCQRHPAADSPAAATAALVQAGIAENEQSFVLTLGDNTYPDGTAREFETCFEPTWGRFKARMFPAVGNHEYHMPAATGYYQYFGDAAGKPGLGYYSKNLGPWHVIALNSNLRDDALNQQLEWLRADLAHNPSPCTLAFWHHPLFSSGGHGNNERIKPYWTILQQAGADIILVGHDHDYERFAPQDAQGQRDDIHGMREFVVGTGGATLSPFLITKTNSETRYNDGYGVLRLRLEDGTYRWDFLGTGRSNYHDHGSAVCHRGT